MSNNSMDLHIRLSDEEYQTIKENAKAAEKTVSAYVRYIACNMCILQHNYSLIEEHTNQLTAIKNAIVQLTYTIIKTRKYVPTDLEYIYNKFSEIVKTENEFLKTYSKSKIREEKILSKQLK